MYLIGAAELTQNCGAQLTSKTHFYCKKLNSYEHLQMLWGTCNCKCLNCLPILVSSYVL